jgi:hypothetical protein
MEPSSAGVFAGPSDHILSKSEDDAAGIRAHDVQFVGSPGPAETVVRVVHGHLFGVQ